MPAFFMISGFFARKSINLGVRQCMSSKLSRLALPALIWSLFSLAFYVLVYMKGVALSKVIVCAFRTTWFLWSLTLFYLIGTVIWKSRFKYYLATILCLILWFTHEWQNPYLFDYLHISRELPCFFFGLIYSEILASGKRISKANIITVWVISLIVYLIEYYRYSFGLGGYQTRCVLLLAGGIVFLPLIKMSFNYMDALSPKLTAFIVRLGGASMGIYLIDSIFKKIISFSVQDYQTGNILILLIIAATFTLIYFGVTLIIRKNNYTKKYLLGE